MTAAAAVRPLDRARARRVTEQLRGALELAVDLLAEAYAGRAWSALGYDSWDAYCREELPALAVLVRGLPAAERRGKVAELRAGGMSLRAVSSATGLAPNTVRTDAAAAGVQLAEVVDLRGARRSATAAESAPRPRLSNVARALLVVREAGDAGVTVHALTKRLRLSQSATSALLSRLAADGRLTYRAPARRGQVGTYVTGRIG